MAGDAKYSHWMYFHWAAVELILKSSKPMCQECVIVVLNKIDKALFEDKAE